MQKYSLFMLFLDWIKIYVKNSTLHMKSTIYEWLRGRLLQVKNDNVLFQLQKRPGRYLQEIRNLSFFFVIVIGQKNQWMLVMCQFIGWSPFGQWPQRGQCPMLSHKKKFSSSFHIPPPPPLNPSFEAQISDLRPKFQPRGPNPSLEA